MIQLVVVLLKLGRDKEINGRSSVEILLRENYLHVELLTPGRLTLGWLTTNYFIS